MWVFSIYCRYDGDGQCSIWWRLTRRTRGPHSSDLPLRNLCHCLLPGRYPLFSSCTFPITLVHYRICMPFIYHFHAYFSCSLQFNIARLVRRLIHLIFYFLLYPSYALG